MSKIAMIAAGAAVLALAGGSAYAAAPKPGPYTPAYEIVTQQQSVPITSGSQNIDVTATCPPGKSVTGGGFSDTLDGRTPKVHIGISRPDSQGAGWLISGWVDSTLAQSTTVATVEITAYAVCAAQ